jgi:hypothetical protein
MRTALLAAAICLAGAGNAAAAPFDGKWFADVPAVQGCNGNAPSTVTLLVAGADIQGQVRNIGGTVGVIGTLDADGNGDVRVARNGVGTIRFQDDRFEMDWLGDRNCRRHASGDRALDEAAIARLTAERRQHQETLADLIRAATQGRAVDYARLRAEYVYSADWDFYDTRLGTLLQQADAAAKGGDCTQAVSLADRALRTDFILDSAHAIRADCLKASDPAQAKIALAIANGLIRSLMTSGDGQSQRTAYVVSTLREENDVLANRKIVLRTRQERVRGSDGRYYDVVQGVSQTDGKTVNHTVYFNIDSFMKGRASQRAVVASAAATIDRPAPAPTRAAAAPSAATVLQIPPGENPREKEFVSLYMAICLSTYPDEKAVADFARQLGASEVSPAETEKLLRMPERHGHGWVFKGRLGEYKLLLNEGLEPGFAAAMPNLRAPSCLLMTNAPKGLNLSGFFDTAVRNKAAQLGVQPINRVASDRPEGHLEALMLGPASGLMSYSFRPVSDTDNEYRLDFRPPG